ECGCCESLTKVDPLSLTCASGMAKRGNNHKRRAYTASGVWVARPNTRGLSVWPTGQVHNTCLRFLHWAIRDIVFIRTPVPKAGHRAVDNSRIDFAQALKIKTNGFHSTCAEIFQHKIAHCNQSVDKLTRLLALHIKVDTIFAAI